MKLTRKSIGRIAASFVATAMLATMAIVPASAEGAGDTVTKLPSKDNVVSFTKTIDMTNADGAGIPTGTFTFNVTQGTPADGETAGVLGAITDEDSSTEGTQIVITSDGTSTSLTGDIAFTPNTFGAVGTYVYNLQEVTGANADIDYHTSDVYVLRVNVENANATTPDGKNFVIGECTLQKNDGTKVSNITNEYSTYDLKITKTVEGSMGVQTTNFPFTVIFENVPATATSITLNNAEELTTFASLYDEDTDTYKVSFSLQGGKDFVISGLPSGVTYTIVESDNDYTTTVQGTGDTSVTASKTYSGDMKVDGAATDITVDYTNTLDASTPTGIMMDIAPYAVLVVIAAAGCFIFLRKRHAKED